MDNVYRKTARVEGHSRGYELDLSPVCSDFEIMQYIRQPLRPAREGFSILINAALLELHEVKIDVLKGSKIEVRVKHPLKRNLEGLWMSRDAVYTYELPPEFCKKAFKAQWFEDNFLQIKANSSEMDEKECVDRASLVIERVDTRFKSAIEISVLKEFVEDIRNRAQDTLQYLRFTVNDSPSLVKKDSQDMVNKLSGKLSTADSGVISKTDFGTNSGVASMTDSGIASMMNSLTKTA